MSQKTWPERGSQKTFSKLFTTYTHITDLIAKRNLCAANIISKTDFLIGNIYFPMTNALDNTMYLITIYEVFLNT